MSAFEREKIRDGGKGPGAGKGIHRRSLRGLFLALAAVTLLSLLGMGCKKEKGAAPVEIPPACTILYEAGLKNTAAALSRTLGGVTGEAPELMEAGTGETPSGFLILVGDTGLPESEEYIETLGENSYGVKILRKEEGTRILLAGGTPALSEKAVYLFLSDYLSGEKGETMLMKNEDTTLTEKYPAKEPQGNEEITDGSIFAGITFEKDVISVVPEGGYARICALSDGRLILAYGSKRSGETYSRIRAVFSSDKGKTWSEPVLVTDGVDEDLVCANGIPYQLADGTILVGYRANDPDSSAKTPPGGAYHSSIRVMQSKDGGKTWTRHSIVWDLYETNITYKSYGVWEPHFGILNGELACFFAIGKSVYGYNHIINSVDIFVYRNGEWVRADYTSDDNRIVPKIKNGMPVWQPIAEGGYILALETTQNQSRPYANVLTIKLLTSKDGKEWLNQCDVYIPHKVWYRSGAPYVVQLPDGRFVVSYMTDEDLPKPMKQTGSETGMRIKLSVSKPGKTAYDLSSPNDFDGPFDVFGLPEGATSTYAGMYIDDEYLYVCAHADYPTKGIILRRAPLRLITEG